MTRTLISLYGILITLLIFGSTPSYVLAQDEQEDKSQLKLGIHKSILPVGFTTDDFAFYPDYTWSGFLPSLSWESDQKRTNLTLTSFGWGRGQGHNYDTLQRDVTFFDASIEYSKEYCFGRKEAMTRYWIGPAFQASYYETQSFTSDHFMDSLYIYDTDRTAALTFAITNSIEARVSDRVSVIARASLPIYRFAFGDAYYDEYDMKNNRSLSHPGRTHNFEMEAFRGKGALTIGANIIL